MRDSKTASGMIGPAQPVSAEMEIVIPRDQVNGELSTFGDELRMLQALLGPFQEIHAGTRSDVALKSISSSEFTIVLEGHQVGWRLSRLDSGELSRRFDRSWKSR